MEEDKIDDDILLQIPVVEFSFALKHTNMKTMKIVLFGILSITWHKSNLLQIGNKIRMVLNFFSLYSNFVHGYMR